jgi:demethylmenaquinone methyltransferase / 2-methoxy-6-polyprenyl-1,4-benzoquinol methylase
MSTSGQKQGKKEQVRSMFNDIAFRYDFLNHFLSAGIDIRWRKKVRRMLAPESPKKILDVATGTGDLAIELANLNPEEIKGVDIADGMLEIGRKKISKKGLEHMISLQTGDAENLAFDDNAFDAVVVAFGVRNYENLQKGLQEMCRVMRPGGTVAILEFSRPNAFPFKQIYNSYFRYILPGFGRMISKHKEAYTYLPDSVSQFKEGEDFLREMEKAGYRETRQKRLTMGIATLYSATK